MSWELTTQRDEKEILCRHKRFAEHVLSNQNPFTPPLDEFVEHHPNIAKRKPTDIKAKELGSITRTQFQANVCLGRTLQAWILDLPCNLIQDLYSVK